MQDINVGQKSPNTADILCPISYKKCELLLSAEVWRGKTHATLELPTNAADEVKKSLIFHLLSLSLLLLEGQIVNLKSGGSLTRS